MTLWKYNRITGYWVYARDTTPETADQWLRMFQTDEPNEFFRVSAKRPSKRPTR